jgi:hypothetical protein
MNNTTNNELALNAEHLEYAKTRIRQLIEDLFVTGCLELPYTIEVHQKKNDPNSVDVTLTLAPYSAHIEGTIEL